MKDHELRRIADDKTQTNKAKTIVSAHNDMLRTERMNPDRFTRTKGAFASVKHVEIATAKVLSQSKLGSKPRGDTYGESQPPGDVKSV
jgi:hypothetical protein